MILAGDIGGTKTRLGLFDYSAGRPRPVAVGVFSTLDYAHLPAIISAFATAEQLRGDTLRAACFGVAGPVVGEIADLTNVPWRVDAGEVAATFGIPRVRLLNDLEAMAHCLPVLQSSELLVLQEGTAIPSSNIGLIAAGTGLGEAILHNLDGRFVPVAQRGGHGDFAARNEREIDLLRNLLQRFGHAEVEHVVSGMGLVNLHRVTHGGAPCPAAADLTAPEAPASITSAALDRRCDGCVEALTMFVDAYGAEAGNLALRSLALAGIYVGGGIAPKILPALTDGRFVRAFRHKAPAFQKLLASIPIKVILIDEAGLLGAAVYAASAV